jgi:hypothetical protein
MGEVGIVAPTQLIGSLDPGAIQILALANREGKEFADYVTRNGGWPILRVEYSFTLQNGVANYALPDDYAYSIPMTTWDRTRKWQNVGPLSAQEWQVLKSGISPTGPRFRYRIIEPNFVVDPTPSSTNLDTMAFEYISKNWCSNSSGSATYREWKDDTNVFLLDEDAFVLGIKWRWLRAKGLDYTQEKYDYDNKVARYTARAGGNRDLPINATQALKLISSAQIPDTGYGA